MNDSRGFDDEDRAESFAPFLSWFKTFSSKENCLDGASSDPSKFLKSFRSQIKQQEVKAAFARWKKSFKENSQLVKALVGLHNQFAKDDYDEMVKGNGMNMPGDNEPREDTNDDIMPSLVESAPIEASTPPKKIESAPPKRFSIDPADSEFGISSAAPKPKSKPKSKIPKQQYIRPPPRVENSGGGLERFSQLCEKLPPK
jgi:hypothetical protein